MEKFVKITVGFIQQTFEKEPDGEFICTDQAFIAGDQCDYEDVNGDPLKDIPEHQYEPYEMLLPQNKRQAVKYLLYNDVLGSMESEEPIEANSLEEALSEVLNSMGYSIIEAQKRKEEQTRHCENDTD
ncbi:MAG: hypothetical protein H8D56_12935 [Planctomycetes bacterium]|nr:hypothetical protein [Planctomycetota bacterium]